MALADNNYLGDWQLSPDGRTLTNPTTGQNQPNYQYGIDAGSSSPLATLNGGASSLTPGGSRSGLTGSLGAMPEMSAYATRAGDPLQFLFGGGRRGRKTMGDIPLDEASPILDDEEGRAAGRNPLWNRTWDVNGTPYRWLPAYYGTGKGWTIRDQDLYNQINSAAIPMPDMPGTGRQIYPSSLGPWSQGAIWKNTDPWYQTPAGMFAIGSIAMGGAAAAGLGAAGAGAGAGAAGAEAGLGGSAAFLPAEGAAGVAGLGETALPAAGAASTAGGGSIFSGLGAEGFMTPVTTGANTAGFAGSVGGPFATGAEALPAWATTGAGAASAGAGAAAPAVASGLTLANMGQIGGGLFQLWQAAQARGDTREAQRILQQAFERSDPFAPARVGAMNQYMQWQQDPMSYLNSPLAQMQIEALNQSVRAKQAQLGQTWNIDPATGGIRGSGIGAVDFARTLQTNLANQYETALGNRAQQAGMSLFPNMGAFNSLADLTAMGNQARSQFGGGLGNVIGGGVKLFPQIGQSAEQAWRSIIGA